MMARQRQAPTAEDYTVCITGSWPRELHRKCIISTVVPDRVHWQPSMEAACAGASTAVVVSPSLRSLRCTPFGCTVCWLPHQLQVVLSLAAICRAASNLGHCIWSPSTCNSACHVLLGLTRSGHGAMTPHCGGTVGAGDPILRLWQGSAGGTNVSVYLSRTSSDSPEQSELAVLPVPSVTVPSAQAEQAASLPTVSLKVLISHGTQLSPCFLYPAEHTAHTHIQHSKGSTAIMPDIVT